jgi:hypothetical protein
MVLQKNMDPTLPATHTIELRFLPGRGTLKWQIATRPLTVD